MLRIGLQTSQPVMPHLAMISPAWNHIHSSVVTKPPSRAALTGSWLKLAAWTLFSSVTQLCPALCDPMNRSTPGLTVHHQLPELTQTQAHWVSDAIQPSHPLSPLLLLPLIFPSIRVFSNESALGLRWPKYWRFSFSISPSNEYSGLISFRMDWLDLLAVQGTLKSLLQHHSSKASILLCSAFFSSNSHIHTWLLEKP